ncbi:MAG: M23 family metallopeptidase [Acidobacteria bacterium]|nr:M23 family metallopeptidase [Acidobacteriota bacterium]
MRLVNVLIALGATALIAGLAQLVLDVRPPLLAVLAIYITSRWVVGRLRGPARGSESADAPDLRESWPISGPIGRFGPRAPDTVWAWTQWLILLNPFQVLEMVRQSEGDSALVARETRSGDDCRGYETRAVYTLPFEGEWLLCNGGATPETSHSWDVLGQRFALDFVQANEAFERHTGRGTRAADYFCYGQDILAAADGTVVRLESRVRQAFLGWGICDFTARSFVGNHVLIEHAEGEFALYAHLIRGSVTVAPGDRVTRGQVIGRCGHSGHSTEPHLHFHLQDSRELWEGMGLPVRFSGLLVDGEPADEMLLTAGNRVRPRH